MPRRYSTDELIRALSRIGITVVRQRGSHIRCSGMWRNEMRYVSLVASQRVVHPGTLNSILKQAGISFAELESLTDGEEISE
jgi:predicted RNA binding protein YcfA (HicA-like mRNA interferase family)